MLFAFRCGNEKKNTDGRLKNKTRTIKTTKQTNNQIDMRILNCMQGGMHFARNYDGKSGTQNYHLIEFELEQIH